MGKSNFEQMTNYTSNYQAVNRFRGKYVKVQTIHGTFTGYLRKDSACFGGEYRIANDIIKVTDIQTIEEI